MVEMTPRERVMAALRHEEPDRVPLDIGGGQSTSLVAEAYENFKRFIGFSAPERSLQEIYRVARLDEEVMLRLGSDVRPVILKPPRNWTPPPSEPGTTIDEFGVKWRQVSFPGGFYWEVVESPFAEATIADLESFPWPDPLDPGRYDGLAEEVEHLYYHTPYALLGDCGFKNFFEKCWSLLGMERALVDLVADQEFYRVLLDRLFEINVAATQRFLEIAGPYLTAIRTSDDLATQDSLLMSPRTYRTLIKPYHTRYFALIKEWTDAKIFYHSCGNIVPLLDDLIEAGIEVLNPVQATTWHDPADVKARYGDRLSFWGGIDSQRVLPYGTPQEVRREVALRIQQFGRGGGFVAGSVHLMQADVPPQNVLAMSAAVRELGVCPLDTDALSAALA
jgi:uroporphyrinogen decarboxylase